MICLSIDEHQSTACDREPSAGRQAGTTIGSACSAKGLQHSDNIFPSDFVHPVPGHCGQLSRYDLKHLVEISQSLSALRHDLTLILRTPSLKHLARSPDLPSSFLSLWRYSGIRQILASIASALASVFTLSVTHNDLTRCRYCCY